MILGILVLLVSLAVGHRDIAHARGAGTQAAPAKPAEAMTPIVAAEQGRRGVAENPYEELAAVERQRLAARAGRPEAVAPLLALFELADALPLGSLDGTVQALIHSDQDHAVARHGAVGTDPLVTARARDWLARRLEEKGDEEGAAAMRAPLGALTRLWVVGPFGDGRASIETAFPPESEGDLPDPTRARAYMGKERQVRWRRAEKGALRRGALELGSLLRPDTQAAAYVAAFVHVEKGGVAALRLGTPGPVKIWCNGRLVHAQDRVRAARLDQDAAGVLLKAGWNRLLVKTVVTDGIWRLFARLTAPDGRPLQFANDWQPESGSGGGVAALAPLAAAGGSPVSSRIAVRTLESLLRQRVRAARGAPARAEAELDLGHYLLMVDSADRDQKEATAAFEASATDHASVDALTGLASAAREEDESRRALERALATATTPREAAAVLAALGDIAHDQRRESVAVERWRAALDKDARWWPATLSLAGEEAAAGFPAASLARIDGLPPVIRVLRPVRRERIRMLMTLDRRREAEEERRGLLGGARDNADLLRELGSAARARGDGAESVRLLARAAALRPDLPSLTIEWARALEGAGNREAARAALETAAGRLPDEATLAAELGKVLDRMGQREAATRWLRTALELRPQDPELRRYADALSARTPGPGGESVAGSPGGGAPSGGQPSLPAVAAAPGLAPLAHGRAELARRFAAAVPPLLAAEARRAVAPGARAGTEPDTATVLLDRHAVRVHPNGLSEVFAQRVVQVRTDSGAQDNKDFLVRYTPGSEEVEILEARIFRRDASGAVDILQASDRDDQDLSEPWYGLYYDYRAEVVRFEGLRAGDVLEVQYVVSDVSRENQLAGYFGDLQFIAEAVPKRQWDYTLLAPAGRQFYFARPVVAGLTETSSDEGGEHITRFVAHDVPRIEVEPAMPGLAEVSPYLHISTYKTWDEVGKWYWRLIEEQLVPDDTIRRAADSALRAAAPAVGRRGKNAGGAGDGGRGLTDLDKVRALHSLVLGGTRYVGLEFGIHGFKPYKVSQVLARKFGDCKDKAALLTALLTQAGVEAEMVLLRTRRGGRIAPAPASLAVFDHAIVYVPKLGMYLDGTAEFSGMRELPGEDQGTMVLRVSARGTQLVETPMLPSSDNRAVRTWTVRLDPQGDGEVDEQLGIDGQAAPEWRSHYQTPGERMDRYAKVWTGRNPGARLEAVEMSGIDDRNHPVTVRARALVPRIAERTSDGSLLLMMGARDADLVRTYARLSSRRLDLVLAYPWQHQEVLRYELPAGYAVTSLPRARHIQSKFGSFDLRVRVQEKHERQDDPQRDDRLPPVPPGTVIAEARLDVQRDRIPAGDYAAFRKFLADVDEVMAERIVVERASEAGVNSAPSSAAAHEPGASASDEQPAAPGRPQHVVERARGAGAP
ncbi:MAG: DUF3857 domain-containing protein [Polyangia bacterium]